MSHLRNAVRAVLVAAAIGAAIVPPAEAADDGATGTAHRAACELLGPVTNLSTPVGTQACPGVRPGGLVATSLGGCTLNFLFVDSRGIRYIGTAGHCILADGGEERWARGAGPEATVDGKLIGRFVYAILDVADMDFALIRLEPDVEASPEMCHFGGPTGMYTEHASERVEVHHFGNGIVLGNLHNKRRAGVGDSDLNTLSARSGFLPHTRARVRAAAFTAGVNGDSGSGVITGDGRAFGVLVTLLGYDDWGLPYYGTNGVTRLDTQVARAEQVLGRALTLQTAPLR